MNGCASSSSRPQHYLPASRGKRKRKGPAALIFLHCSNRSVDDAEAEGSPDGLVFLWSRYEVRLIPAFITLAGIHIVVFIDIAADKGQ